MLKLESCDISSNNAESWGGGIFIFLGNDSNVNVMKDCNISDNRASGRRVDHGKNIAIGQGGGLVLFHCTVNMDSCKVINNFAEVSSGGIFILDTASILTSTDCDIKNNIVNAFSPYTFSPDIHINDENESASREIQPEEENTNE